MTQTTINGMTYTVENMGKVGEAQASDMANRGWDGNNYLLTGKRGAVKMAYRNATTGDYSICCGL